MWHTAKSTSSKMVIVVVALVLAISVLLDLTKLWWPLQSAAIDVVSSVVAPWQAGISNARDTWQYLQTGGSIWQQQQALQQQLADAQNQLTQLAKLQAENDWLKQQLKLLPKNLTFQFAVAELVKYEFAPVPGYALLELRSNQVQPQDWVLADGYVIGRIVEVQGNFARMQLITANDFRATIQVGAIAGRVTGNRGVAVVVSGIPSSRAVADGTRVILDSQTWPHLRNFALGTFRNSTSDGAAAELTGELVLPIDLQQLSYLLIAPTDGAR